MVNTEQLTVRHSSNYANSPSIWIIGTVSGMVWIIELWMWIRFAVKEKGKARVDKTSCKLRGIFIMIAPSARKTTAEITLQKGEKM